MPHQCTNCSRVFPDGSDEILQGCPQCGGTQFRYRPDIQSNDTTTVSNQSSSEDSAQAEARAAIVDRSELPSKPCSSGSTSSASSPENTERLIESDNQPDQQNTSLSSDQLCDPSAPQQSSSELSSEHASDTIEDPETVSSDPPDQEELRDELNDQFEGIKIIRPGEYELNLMELYNRETYIISLLEDGRYSIQLPDDWDGSPNNTDS